MIYIALKLNHAKHQLTYSQFNWELNMNMLMLYSFIYKFLNNKLPSLTQYFSLNRLCKAKVTHICAHHYLQALKCVVDLV